MHFTTVSREVELDPGDPRFGSYGKILDHILSHPSVLIVTLDLTTPSSASQPTFSVTLHDTPENRQAIADLFNDELDELEFS